MDKIKLAQRTIALLSSMVHSGEQHTSRSSKMVENALKGLEEVKNCTPPDEGQSEQLCPNCGSNMVLGTMNNNWRECHECDHTWRV